MEPREEESMGDTGLEHIAKSPQEQQVTPQGGAESGAVVSPGSTLLSPALTEVMARWSRVPDPIQAAILTIVRASG
jgi:hypothetical protein